MARRYYVYLSNGRPDLCNPGLGRSLLPPKMPCQAMPLTLCLFPVICFPWQAKSAHHLSTPSVFGSVAPGNRREKTAMVRSHQGRDAILSFSALKIWLNSSSGCFVGQIHAFSANSCELLRTPTNSCQPLRTPCELRAMGLGRPNSHVIPTGFQP